MKRISLFTVIILILSSCGSKNEISAPVSTTPVVPAQVPVTVVTENTVANEFVQMGNTIAFETPKFLKISRRRTCSYIIKTQVEISNINVIEDSVEITVRKSERESRGNVSACPEHYRVRKLNVKTYALTKLLETYKLRRDESLNADLLCRRTKWCQKAKLLKKRAITFREKPAIYTQIRLISKSGKKYIRSSWTSKEILFLNTFAFQVKNESDSKIVDFKRTTNFSLK